MSNDALSVSMDTTLATTQKATRVRWMLLGVMWIGCLVAYLDRINLSVCGAQIMQEYGFDKVQLGMAMSAFFLAYMIMQIPAGVLSEKFGIRIIGAVALIFWSIFTALTPLAWGFMSFLIVRFLFGIGESPVYPNSGVFIARWLNKQEKAIAGSVVVMGATIAPAVGPPLTVWIMTTWNWQMVFYSYAGLGVVIGLIWYILSRDYPHQHPQVNRAEIEHIAGKSVEEVKATEKLGKPSWKKILRSSQVWALGIQHFLNSYITFVYLSWLPIYLLEARGLTLKAMGMAAAYPWLAISAGPGIKRKNVGQDGIRRDIQNSNRGQSRPSSVLQPAGLASSWLPMPRQQMKISSGCQCLWALRASFTHPPGRALRTSV